MISGKVRETRRGVALVLVLVFLVMLSIILVAFSSSSGIERLTSRGYLQLTQAEAAALLGAEEAKTLMLSLIAEYPDSATAWDPALGGSTTPGTAFFFRRPGLRESIADGANGTDQSIHYLPLLSGARSGLLEDRSTTLPSVSSGPDSSINLNSARFSLDAFPWLGLFESNGEPTEVRVPWVNLENEEGEIEARYAFWIEDESFKVPLNRLGPDPLSASNTPALERSLPAEGLIELIESGNAAALASNLLTLRSELPGEQFTGVRQVNHSDGAPVEFGEALRFLSTIYSGSANLSRTGARRLNLNTVIPPDPHSLPQPAEAIEGALRRMVAAIENQSPDFGQRFYRVGGNLNDNTTVSDDRATQYLYKIAANLHDYVDTDNQPVVVTLNAGEYSVMAGPPQFAIQPPGGVNIAAGTNPVVAMGKENVPYFTEYVVRGRLNMLSPMNVSSTSPADPSAQYDLEIDHYFEFWNMTPADLVPANGDLGPNPFLRVYNQPEISGERPEAHDGTGNQGGDIPSDPSRDFDIPLAEIPDLVFRAGQRTVITTDPTPATQITEEAEHVYSAEVVYRAGTTEPFGPGPSGEMYYPFSHRHYRGRTERTQSSDGNFRINLLARAGNPNARTDSFTKVFLGNDLGILDSFPAVTVARTSGSFPISFNFDDPPRANTSYNFFRGSRLPGRDTDPRANNEPIQFQFYQSTQPIHAAQNTRINNVDNLSWPPHLIAQFLLPAQSRLGALNFDQNPNEWPDPAPSVSSHVSTPMTMTNGPLLGIGSLGNLYDPARRVSTAAQVATARGGGRHLRIGQPDEFYDDEDTSASRNWAAWRLADIFCTHDELWVPGTINLNGLRRDNGAALRALLHNYQFQATPPGDPLLGGLPLTGIDGLIDALTDRLDQDRPLWERGELSEISIFAEGNQLHPAVNMAEATTRGREELFRQLVDWTTPKGNVFTVYSVGQTLQNGRVMATRAVKITFRILPQFDEDEPFDFDPEDDSEVAERFRAPDQYRLEILAVEG